MLLMDHIIRMILRGMRLDSVKLRRHYLAEEASEAGITSTGLHPLEHLDYPTTRVLRNFPKRKKIG